MIDLQVFANEINELAEYFGKNLTQKHEQRLYLILNAELGTEEFKQAVMSAYRNCKFFPTPAELIESVHGTIEDLAIKQWDNIENLSPVGKEALASIGGKWAVKESEKPEVLRSQFIKAFKAYAVGKTSTDFSAPPAYIDPDCVLPPGWVCPPLPEIRTNSNGR